MRRGGLRGWVGACRYLGHTYGLWHGICRWRILCDWTSQRPPAFWWRNEATYTPSHKSPWGRRSICRCSPRGPKLAAGHLLHQMIPDCYVWQQDRLPNSVTCQVKISVQKGSRLRYIAAKSAPRFRDMPCHISWRTNRTHILFKWKRTPHPTGIDAAATAEVLAMMINFINPAILIIDFIDLITSFLQLLVRDWFSQSLICFLTVH